MECPRQDAVAGGDNLDEISSGDFDGGDLVRGKADEIRQLRGISVCPSNLIQSTHEASDDRGMPDDEQIILVSFQFKDDRLQSDCITVSVNLRIPRGYSPLKS